ncbi:hypothetical protein F5888DRAFT_1807743 [Russula emetica]|nr:hypothetical protein F5888DRAFT_1807743 [Russula emetica]
MSSSSNPRRSTPTPDPSQRRLPQYDGPFEQFIIDSTYTTPFRHLHKPPQPLSTAGPSSFPRQVSSTIILHIPGIDSTPRPLSQHAPLPPPRSPSASPPPPPPLPPGSPLASLSRPPSFINPTAAIRRRF